MLEIKNVYKTFNPGTVNQKVALNDLNLTLEDGDFVTVIGGNGAGKSTMLNAVAGVWPVDMGKIIIDGKDITRLPEHKRAAYIGRVFQDPMMGTAATMQIDENLALAARRGAGRKPRTLRPQELSDLCRQLSTLLASGVSLVRALTIISQDESISAGLRRIYESVLGEVRKGSSLSAALEAQQVFPTLMLGMIRAGEGSAKLDQVAERLAIHYEKAHQMNQQVKSALMYPMILAILAVAVVIVIVTFVLPQFSDLFSTMDSLPGVTLALMAFSNFMVTKWYLMILGVAAANPLWRTDR